MDKNDINLFELSYDDINAMKKRDLVNQIEKMRGKVIVGSHIKDLCRQIGKFTKNLNDVMATNKKTASELSIVRNVNSNLEHCITALEKLQAKTEQYNRWNTVEISGIWDNVSDNDLEQKVIRICKDSNIVITSSNIEVCHRLSLARNSTNKNKQVIKKSVNRKQPELMLHLKTNNSKCKVYINNLLCP